MMGQVVKCNSDLDKSKMKDAINSFPFQIEEAIDIANKWVYKNEFKNINNILILGMGGSAIGGDILKVILHNNFSLPIVVNRTYNIPAWVNSKTLILACSYSGNTEETLNAFYQCLEQNSQIIIFTTGGKLKKCAEKYKIDCIQLPKGYQPRAAIGFALALLPLVLNKIGFVNNIIIKDIYNSISSIKSLSVKLNKPNNIALDIAKKIHRTCPIIYGTEDLTGVIAFRFRCQLAENAKMLAFHHNFPEQNHNEIEGWTSNANIFNNFSIIWIRDIDDHSGIKKRMDVSYSLLESKPSTHIVIDQTGINKIQRLLKLIHLTDWISYYTALLNNVDPTPVEIIETLKSKIN